MTFTERLNKVRLLRCMSQKDLASATGLKASAISHFEKGRRRPNFHNLIKLADALAVNIDYLLQRTENIKYCGRLLDFSKISNLSLSDQNFLADMAEKLALNNQ